MNSNETLGNQVPRNSRRGCLCRDGKTYSRRCCDGTLRSQGIGSPLGKSYLLQENADAILQENDSKIKL